LILPWFSFFCLVFFSVYFLFSSVSKF
jgi:hypothetical protein